MTAECLSLIYNMSIEQRELRLDWKSVGAYKTLCLPYLEYAAAAWNPSSREGLSDIEQLYNQAVRFIAGIKGRNGIDDAKARTYFATKKEKPAIESFDAHSC